MQNNKLNWLLILVLVVLLSSCKKVYDVEVIQEQGRILFSFSSLMQDLPKEQQLYLMELEIMLRNCEQDCQQWFLSAKEAKVPLTTDKVIYGIRPEGLVETIKPKVLVGGEYSIDGFILVKEGNNEVKTINFRKKFIVEP